MKNKKNFVRPFHGLRGVASLMVFGAHITNGYHIHVATFVPEYIQKIISNIGTFGVEIFFFLSGYVIYKSAVKTDWVTFFKHRFWRIYPVFFLFTFIYFVGNYFLNLEPEKNSVTFFFINIIHLNLFLGTPYLTPNSWSVSYEIWYYIITIFLVSYFVKEHKAIFWLALVCSLLLAYILVEHPITIYFLLGVSLAIIAKKFRKLSIAKLQILQFFSLILIISLTGIGVEFCSNGWEGLMSDYKQIMLPIALLLFMAVTIQNEKLIINRILVSPSMMLIGTISYSLYLLHPYSYLFIRKMFESSLLSELNVALHYMLFVFISTCVTILSSYLLNKYFENPIYKLMTRKNIYIS